MQGILAIDVVTALIAILPLLVFTVPQPARADLQAGGSGKSFLLARPARRVPLRLELAWSYAHWYYGNRDQFSAHPGFFPAPHSRHQAL